MDSIYKNFYNGGKVGCPKVVFLCKETTKSLHVLPRGFILHSPTTMFSSNARPLPQRTSSLNAAKYASYFSSIDEELRDSRRVQRQGQEEDLREALSRMMARVEEMVRYHWKHSPLPSYCATPGRADRSIPQCETLKSSYQTTTDLETQLTMAESNLKLALANNEMLEDALRSGSLSKDVGWRRSSRDTGSMQSFPSPVPATATAAATQSQHPASIDEGETQGVLDSPGSDPENYRAPSPAPAPQNDSRFFRFRFSSSGRSTPTQPSTPTSPPPRASRSQRTSHSVGGHLTSASLPSLVASPSPPPPLPAAPAPVPQPVANNELEELREQLSAEKRKSEKFAREKSELESEIENLSQALFEEVRHLSIPRFCFGR